MTTIKEKLMTSTYPLISLTLRWRQGDLAPLDGEVFGCLIRSLHTVVDPVPQPVTVPARVRALRRWLHAELALVALGEWADSGYGFESPSYDYEQGLRARLPGVIKQLGLSAGQIAGELERAADQEPHDRAADMTLAEYDWMFIDDMMSHTER
jgi:hypothetical protein